MSAIITDQFRILSAENFMSSVELTSNSYYAFVGLTNSTDYKSDWEESPLDPIDSFYNYSDIWDTTIALKKINPNDVMMVVRKINWESGIIYDMYRHDVWREKLSKPSNKTSLYKSNYYVMNSDYQVYICLHNGQDPENPNGKPSLDEPRFVDLEPRSAGLSGDGYIWKYLYTIKPKDIIKFDSLHYMPVPKNWKTGDEFSAVRDNANSESSGQLKVVLITDRGSGLGAPGLRTNIPIVGDGSGAEATIVVGADSTVESITITNGGNGYTYGVVDVVAGGMSGSSLPRFEVIIPPPGGHGKNIYTELGAKNILVYSRIENDTLDPDFITGNKIARIGIIKNPLNSTVDNNQELLVLNKDKVSNTYALKLGGDYSTASFTPNTIITQNVGSGKTAIGRVISYDKITGILKYWQDRSLVGFSTGSSDLQTSPPLYGYNLVGFSTLGGNIVGSVYSLPIDTQFSGFTTTINSKIYNLGQNFSQGVSSPEVQRYSGEIIYIDNRPSITRSVNQKEDIKVILEF
jgi:hypothetical protein